MELSFNHSMGNYPEEVILMVITIILLRFSTVVADSVLS